MEVSAHYDRTSERAEQARRISVVEDLDRELERFDASLDALRKQLDPVLISRPETEDTVARLMAEPGSAIRSYVDRLRDRLQQLDQIMRDIDL